MSMLADYYALDNHQVGYLKDLLSNDKQPPKKSWVSLLLSKFSRSNKNYDKVDKAFEFLLELSENKDYTDKYYVELDNRWDWLHYVLTGFNGDDKYNVNKTPEQLALYDAFFGQEILHFNGGACLVDSDKIFTIVQSLNDIDIDKRLAMVDFKKFNQMELYPDIWEDDDYQGLCNELKKYFENFKQFYQNVLTDNRAVLVVIG